MKSLVYFCFLCCFIACNHPPANHAANIAFAPVTEIPSDSLKEQTTLIIKDRNLYDSLFLKELVESKLALVFQLKDEVLVMDTDSTTFPTDLLGTSAELFNKRFHFKGEKGDSVYHLNLKTLNYTSLNYHFELVHEADTLHQKHGQVHLSPFFFLGDETDIDDKTGNGYFSSEYSTNVDSCFFSIRVGRDEGDLKAKIIQFCEGQEDRNIELEDGPTLRLEEVEK